MKGGIGRGVGIAVRAVLVVIALFSVRVAAADPPFYMGADISLETFMQQQNVTFTDGGVAKPLDTLMYDRGANLFRLRVFVNPQSTYTNSNSGAIQSTAYDIALAQQIKAHAPYAKILLDFHYSDTWADPGKQTKPAAWAGLTTAQLQSTAQSYTQSTLQAFKDAGVMPDMVQVGNEISNGMLWNTGKLVYTNSAAEQASWQSLGALLNAEIQGVRAAQGAGPKINVAIHVDQGDWNGHPQYYFGPDAGHGNIERMTDPAWGNVSDFDVIGLSYYPTTPAAKPNNSFAYLQANLLAVANKNPGRKIMVLETNYPWETSSFGNDSWAKTPAGQQVFLTDLQNALLALPNHAGAGIVYWYPEAVHLPNFTVYNDGATALFDNSHEALAAMNTFGITLVPGDYNRDGVVDAGDYTVWLDSFGTGSNLSANGDNSGASANVVDQADYDFWLAHFGSHAGSGGIGGGGGTVPEPTTAALLFLGLLTMLSWRRIVV